jgi:hypothetical protein
MPPNVYMELDGITCRWLKNYSDFEPPETSFDTGMLDCDREI